MKREKRLTKREVKALRPPRAGAKPNQDQHIHCVACGRHLDAAEFDAHAATATYLQCRHNGSFPSCVECSDRTREILETHDRTGQPVQAASAWH